MYRNPDDPMSEKTDLNRPTIPWIGAAALGLAILLGLLAVLAGFGSRWGIWHFRTGFTLLEWAARGALGVAILSLPVLWFTRPGSGRRGFILTLVGLALALTVFAVPWQWRRTAATVPPIHDITTDMENPPAFVDVVPLRADAPNPVEYAGADVAQQQRAAYPELRPMILDTPLEASFERAMDAVSRMGWEVVGTDPATGRIEATDRTFWFGFRDDVVIRLTPSNGRTIVDVRSKSRVGRSDVGTNARRVRAYLEALDR
jgi:uncharacterized protein (DUF1499 family)